MTPLSTFLNVIICDDHYVSALGIETLLREHSPKNLRIRTASTGKKALDFLDQETPDLILVDLGLPDISGVEVIKQIRERATKPRILVLNRCK